MTHSVNAFRRMPSDGVGTLDLKPVAGKGGNNPGELFARVFDGSKLLQS